MEGTFLLFFLKDSKKEIFKVSIKRTKLRILCSNTTLLNLTVYITERLFRDFCLSRTSIFHIHIYIYTFIFLFLYIIIIKLDEHVEKERRREQETERKRERARETRISSTGPKKKGLDWRGKKSQALKSTYMKVGLLDLHTVGNDYTYIKLIKKQIFSIFKKRKKDG